MQIYPNLCECMRSLLKDTDQILCRIYFQWLPRSLKLFLISFWPFKLQLFEPLEGYKMCCKSLNYIHRNYWGNATNVRFGKMVVAENSGSTELSSKVCLKFYVCFTESSDRIIAIRTYFRHFMCIVSHQKLFFSRSMLCQISNERRSKNSMSILLWATGSSQFFLPNEIRRYFALEH